MKSPTGEMGRPADPPWNPTGPLTSQIISLAAGHLARTDRHLALILKQDGPPPLWGRRQGFATLIRIILEQQVSLSSAASMFRRLSNNIVPFTPDRFVELGESYLRSLGLTRQKSAYCVYLANSIRGRELNLKSISGMNDVDARTELMRIKGIGVWSAEIYLLMALRRPDIWPSGDIALISTVTKLKQLPARPDTDQLLRIAEGWRPFRAVAARMLWQYYLNQRRRNSAIR
jgi:DNA-3-methyladenine glycosylase II